MRAHPLAVVLLLCAAPLAAAAVPNDSGQSRCYDGDDLVAFTWYWSSTPRVANVDFGEVVQAWDVGLDDAHLGFGLEDLSGYVLLVRNAGGYDALAAPAK